MVNRVKKWVGLSERAIKKHPNGIFVPVKWLYQNPFTKQELKEMKDMLIAKGYRVQNASYGFDVWNKKTKS